MKNRKHGLIAFITLGVMLLVACLICGNDSVSADPKGGNGMPEMTIMHWDMGKNDIRKYAVFYTKNQFVVHEIGKVRICNGGVCIPPKTELERDKEGLLLPPPKDVQKKQLGM